MSRLLHQWMIGMTLALLLASVASDLVAYFSNNVNIQAIGLGILVACVCVCSMNTAIQLRVMRMSHEARMREHPVLVSAAQSMLVLLLAVWRGQSGPEAIASFDGSYPVVLACAFFLATYQAWLTTNPRA